MTTFTIRNTEIDKDLVLVTWSDYELDFSVHETLEDALDFIRMNPDIKSLRANLFEIFRKEA